MPAATLHIDDLGGYAGPARCYKLDTPKTFSDGVVAHYVTVWIQPGYGWQDPEVSLVPATETGACLTTSVRRRPGSYVLHDDPDTPEYVEGAYWLALTQLGYEMTR